MQQIVAQGNMMETIKAMRAGQRAGSVFSQGEGAADPFLQIILNMVASMEENSGNDAGALLGFLPEEMQSGFWASGLGMIGSSTQNKEDDLDENLAMMQAAALFFGLQGSQQLSALSQEQLSALAGAVQGIGLDGPSLQGLTEQQMLALTQALSQQQSAAQESEGDLQFQQMMMEVVDSVQEPKTQQGMGELFALQNQFRSAVSQVKQQMSQQPAAIQDGDTELDTDELQSKMSVFRASEGSRALSSQQLMGTKDVGQANMADQIAKGIHENIRLGKNEFVIKLRPEALGEITVRLVEKAGKTVLSITTASAQTARLINADLAALQDAVRPMQVEVREAVPQVQEGQSGQFQPFDFSGHNPGQQAFQYQQETPAYYVDVRPGEENGQETEPVLDTALDTYV